MKIPKVGETYYYVPYDKRDNPFYLVVTKVGRKYIYTDYNKCFNIKTFIEGCGIYSPKGKIYDSKEAYEKHLLVCKCSGELIKMFSLLKDDDILYFHEQVEKRIISYNKKII